MLIDALHKSGSEEARNLASDLRSGKLSLDKCTTFRDEVNKALMEVYFDHSLPSTASPEDFRKLAKTFGSLLSTERKARQGYARVSGQFWKELEDAKHGRDPTKISQEKIEYEISQTEMKLSMLQSRRDRSPR
jgi:hypothetical protein